MYIDVCYIHKAEKEKKMEAEKIMTNIKEARLRKVCVCVVLFVCVSCLCVLFVLRLCVVYVMPDCYRHIFILFLIGFICIYMHINR